MSSTSQVSKRPVAVGPVLTPDLEREVSLVAPSAPVATLIELELLLVPDRLGILAACTPTPHVSEALVVAQGLAVLGLVLLAQVAAAGLVALERVAAHQLGELEEVGDPPGVFEVLVELPGLAVDSQVAPELARGSRGSCSIAS